MNMTPEQLREIALRVACEKAMMFGKDEIVSFAAALFAEFQKLQAEQEPVAITRSGFRLEWVQPQYGCNIKPDTLLYAAPPVLTDKRIAELEGAQAARDKAYAEEWQDTLGEFAAQNAQLREALRESECWSRNYATLQHKDVIRVVQKALALPDLSADWLRKHDAKQLRHYRIVCHLISSIFFYGNFKAETCNESDLETLLRKLGFFYTTEDQVVQMAAELEDGK